MKEEDGTPPTFKTSDAVVAVEVMDACCLSVKVVVVFKEEVRSISSVFTLRMNNITRTCSPHWPKCDDKKN